jgi:hypothetical protein
VKNQLKQSNLPFLLLIAVIVKSLLLSSPIFDSVAIIALSGLFGFKLWLDHIKKPDFNKELHARIDKNQDLFDARFIELENKVTSIHAGLNLSQKTKQNQRVQW